MAGVNDNLIPPVKGEVRNPNGRPKGIPNSKTRYLRLLTLTEKINNPVTGELEEFSIIEQLDMQMIAKARKGDLNAYKEIMDRLEGRAQQDIALQHSGELKTSEADPQLAKEFVEFLKNKTKGE